MKPPIDNLTDTQAGRMLLNEAAYQLVIENAPEELPIYVETRDRYLANPEGFTRSSKSEDEVLGIGEVIAVEAFTAIVFPVIAPILKYLVEKVAEAFQEELGKEAVQWVRGLFAQPSSPKPLFTQDKLEVIAATIRDLAATEAERLGLETGQAGTISDALIARLALANTKK
jgi:hypothetical protein